MPDETLMLLAREVRNKTLKLLDGLTDAQARFAAAGLNNSILWNAGHALVVVEHLGVGLARDRAGAGVAGRMVRQVQLEESARDGEGVAVGRRSRREAEGPAATADERNRTALAATALADRWGSVARPKSPLEHHARPAR